MPPARNRPIVGTPGSAGLGDDYFPLLGNGGYDAQHYLIELDIEPADGSLAGRVTVEATATKNLSSFNLDFSGPTINSLTIGAADVDFIRTGAELVITPAQVIGGRRHLHGRRDLQRPTRIGPILGGPLSHRLEDHVDRPVHGE